MKSLYVIPLLALLCISSCTKTVYETAPSSAVSTPYYRIDGIHDINVVYGYPGGSGLYNSLQLNVSYTTDEQERVELSMQGLPSKLSAEMTTSAGIPTFQSQIYFLDSGVTEGQYPITLVANSMKAGRRSYTFNYTVSAPPDCSSNIVGNGYSAYSGCAISGNYYPMNISAVSGMRNHIALSNVDEAGLQLYADIDCYNQSITIPSQVVNGATYSGYGQFNYYTSNGILHHTVNFNYNKVISGGNQNYCQVQMQL